MISIGMSTSCVYPKTADHAFRLARQAGFDGVEVMVNIDKATQSAERLRELSRAHSIPILSIHAPVLFFTQLIWGTSPRVKLERSAELAKSVGATTVVVHPPFFWQPHYAHVFEKTVRDVAQRTGIEIAVENMFTWPVLGKDLEIYRPGWDPSVMDVDSMTLDFSHAALSGRDSLDLAMAMGEHLRHVHLCDASGSTADGKVFDQHLLPGHGTEPVAEVLGMLAARGWNGSVVAEVKTHHCHSDEQRLAILGETLDYARRAISTAAISSVPAQVRAPVPVPDVSA